MKKIQKLHSINLNLFGKRDPVRHGTITPAEIDDNRRSPGRAPGVVSCPPDLYASVRRCGPARA